MKSVNYWEQEEKYLRKRKYESYQIRWGKPLQNCALLSRERKMMCFLSLVFAYKAYKAPELYESTHFQVNPI